MVTFEDVLKLVNTLSAEEKQALIQHLRQTQVEHPQTRPRVLNLHPGAATMRDDFNDELPDSFWLDEAE